MQTFCLFSDVGSRFRGGRRWHNDAAGIVIERPPQIPPTKSNWLGDSATIGGRSPLIISAVRAKFTLGDLVIVTEVGKALQECCGVAAVEVATTLADLVYDPVVGDSRCCDVGQCIARGRRGAREDDL